MTAGHMFIAHKSGKKILQVDDHLALTIAGGVADAQNIVDILKYYTGIYKLEHRSLMPVKSVARLTSNIFFSARMYPYMAQMLVAGYDSTGPNLFDVDLFGSLNEEKYASTGSGSPVAYGVLENEYKENMTVSQGISLAARSVYAAIQRNSGTGDSIDVAIMDINGFRELEKSEKEKALASVSVRN
uniref:Proteasome endopeptidase complex subunit (PsmB, prcB) n=1 Tax=uncultured marine thaumarchaeote KM3_06_C02 TaxID=1455976 RepID=A0A075G3R1_9ARCH|nr:proteasome endopeptidase complex subunit (psmB, prcB) [uncultured marine thaumarchaeote KM3_06_C02]